ncbi:hypothetical protein BTIS_0079 [Bifidobacterium tissieri]|uniref:Uncharacterized protein n=1 Tax=Bifidobacterium tissieri TaxID=1630162 RepID=A0A261FJT6_9BIFI|nr:hypothetical protein BTIS_0079 [Bifidobacterium tissieri]
MDILLSSLASAATVAAIILAPFGIGMLLDLFR